MTIELNQFRVQGNHRLIISPPDAQHPETQIMKNDLSLAGRCRAAWNGGSFFYGTNEQQEENRTFKNKFFRVLIKSEGNTLADAAVKRAGLAENWQSNPQPLSSREIRVILRQAEHIRRDITDFNTSNFKKLLKNRATLEKNLNEYNDTQPNNKLPTLAKYSPELLRKINNGFIQNNHRTKTVLTDAYLKQLIHNSCAQFLSDREKHLKQAYPHLSNFSVENQLKKATRYDRGFLFANIIHQLNSNGQLGSETNEFKKTCKDTLTEFVKCEQQLKLQTFYPLDCQAALLKLDTRECQLRTLTENIEQSHPATDQGKQLKIALINEMTHQKNLLTKKFFCVNEIMENNPRSQKVAANYQLLWAKAVGVLFDQAIDNNPQIFNMPGNFNAIVLIKQNYISQCETALAHASPTADCDLPSLKPHQEAALDYLRQQLTAIGISDQQIKQLTTRESLTQAWNQTLNTAHEWDKHSRNIVVVKNGVTQHYLSTVTPASHISPAFMRRYRKDGPLEDNGPEHTPRFGVSAAEKTDHYHPRNLKYSEISHVDDNDIVKWLGGFLGHGVLDSWNIADPEQRQLANQRASKEVFTAALECNSRLKAKALANPAKPVKMTMVSVNLITPSPARELLPIKDSAALKDYQELTYTKNQFAAFAAHTKKHTGRNASLVVTDANNQDQTVTVELDAICFSFGINPLATGGLPDAIAGWNEVQEHNEKSMVRFIGDLGSKADFFSDLKSRITGRKPGGFIGHVMELSEQADKWNGDSELHQLHSQLQKQTDLVRRLFLSEAYKNGSIDPAKMSREVGMLQLLAERTLDLIASDEAAMLAKGCKSDKDRGGVVDVELKYALAMEDMGFSIIPDSIYSEEDQDIYNTFAATTQFMTQQYSIGLPGSKEVRNMQQRIPDPHFRKFLTGFSGNVPE